MKQKISYRELNRESIKLKTMNKTLLRELRHICTHFYKLLPEDELWKDFKEDFLDTIKPQPKPQYKEKKDA